MHDVFVFILINRLWPLLLFGVCLIAFANDLSDAVEFRLSPKTIRFAGALLLAIAVGLFLYAYLKAGVQAQ